MADRAFSILHFNAWMIRILGIPWSAHLDQRLRALPRCLAGENADVISLVEVWGNRDKKRLAAALRDLGYPYSTFNSHRFGLGDGLFLASRHPILGSRLSKPFSTCTSRLERFTRKRAMHARILLPGVGPVSLFSTHLGSTYFDSKTLLTCKKSRTALQKQVHELCAFIQESGRDERYLFLAGDLNIHYQSKPEESPASCLSSEYAAILRLFGDEKTELANSYLHANGLRETDPASKAATYSQRNPYVAQAGFTNHPEETLDYIFYLPQKEIRVAESRVVLQQVECEGLRQLSDHYGVKSTFLIRQSKSSVLGLVRGATPVSGCFQADG